MIYSAREGGECSRNNPTKEATAKANISSSVVEKDIK
jgi:hypothetical protein